VSVSVSVCVCVCVRACVRAHRLAPSNIVRDAYLLSGN